MAALRLGAFGLSLEAVDDTIEALRELTDAEAVRGVKVWTQQGAELLQQDEAREALRRQVKVWTQQRAELLRLLDLDNDGRAVEPMARMLAGLLREAALRPDADVGARSRRQRSNAGRATKLPEETERRIAEAYWQRVSDGQKRGALKELGWQHKICDKTVKAIVDRHPPESFRK